MAASVAVRALGLASTLLSAAHGQDGPSLPTLYTHERYVDDVSKASALEIGNVRAVFAYVFSQLPQRVNVYPTENYYYFYFYHDAIRYSGNIRFDVEGRDKGQIEFIYFKETTEWQEDENDFYAALGSADGVVVSKAGELVYDVTFANKTVTFQLNDLASVRPPPESLEADEQFLGPVFDDSGMRFFLLFSRDRRTFQYILDETVKVNDELIGARGMSRVSIGRRTGFAFFGDVKRGRKILIGVFGPNVSVNNYFDGPFDQLPDNFLKGDVLLQALLLARPDLDRPLDRFGASPGGEYRESIAPYLEYEVEQDLAPAQQCGSETDEQRMLACVDAFVAG